MKHILAIFLLLANTAFAQTASVKIIVPYAPGGDDILVREIVDYVNTKKNTDQKMFVENKPGANGIIGSNELGQSIPNGNTWIITNDSLLTVNPFTQSANFNASKAGNIEIIHYLTERGFAFVCNPDSNITSWNDLLANKNKDISLAHPGIGSPAHIAIESLNKKLNLNLNLIPFNGAGQATSAVVTKQTKCAIGTISALMNPIRNNQVTPIYVTTKSRNLPKVPTLSELGITNVDNQLGYLVLYAHKDTPMEIKSKMISLIKEALADPEVNEKFKTNDQQFVSVRDAESFTKNLIRARQPIIESIMK